MTRPPMRHPGPATEPRFRAAPTRAVPVDIALPVGETVAGAIVAGLRAAGCASGWVETSGLACDPFRFVIPARSTDPARAAWYSETHAPPGGATVERAVFSVGTCRGAPFLHCHGLWNGDAPMIGGGHMLCEDSVISAPGRAAGVGFRDAVFDRRPDEETNFELFAADAAGPPPERPNALVVTLRPNEDACERLSALCDAHGLRPARIRGLGSLNGATFADGRRMESALTEFLALDGVAPETGGARVEIAAVDETGRLHRGVLAPGAAAVSVTAEFVIIEEKTAWAGKPGSR